MREARVGFAVGVVHPILEARRRLKTDNRVAMKPSAPIGANLARSTGLFDWIVKPIDGQLLFASIERAALAKSPTAATLSDRQRAH
jgi:hypothetical protein